MIFKTTPGQLARVFSGIQPTGIPHLGNYFGALVQWCQLAKDRSCSISAIQQQQQQQASLDTVDRKQADANDNLIVSCDKPIYCIVDVHAYSSARTQFGQCLYDQILSTTASLLAIGLTPDNCTLIRQSDLFEHNYLDNVLNNFVSTQRLMQMTQFKEKVLKDYTGGEKNNDDKTIVGQKNLKKSIPNGLLNYPVLQAADILLYQTNLVPVGEDQLQHLELTRDIARKFNQTTQSDLFPEPCGLLNVIKNARRLRSLRNPKKKMSKSDADQRSFIEIVDEPEIIRDKIKKAITDSTSAIYYDIEQRPAISNLMHIHHLITGDSYNNIRDQFEGVESARYKLTLADLLIEHFRPIREQYNRIRNDVQYLEQVLSQGRAEAAPLAHKTINQVRKLLGSLRR